MYISHSKIYQIQRDLTQLSTNHPDLYEEVKHVTSLTRQLQVPYMYLADLITDEAREPKPKFIRSSVLDVLKKEVDKLKAVPSFNRFLNIIQSNSHNDTPEIFLLILGAKPEAVVNNAIIK
jgi:hypothetical protein